MRTLLTSAVLASSLVLLTLPGVSQSSASATVSFQLASFQSLSVWGERESETHLLSVYTIPRPTAPERAAGWIERPRALQLLARSNVAWALRVRALDATMGTSDDGQYRKPVSDFYVRAAGQGSSYVPVQTKDQTISGGPYGEHLISIDYRIRVGSEHRDGSYQVTLIYTIATR